MAMAKKFTSMRSDIRKQASTRNVGGGTTFILPEGVNFFTPKKGTTKLSIVPYVVSINKHPAGRDVGDQWFERRFMMHYNIGAESKSYICPKTIGQRCPICEYRLKLAKSQNPDEETLKELRPKDRVLYNVVDLDDDEDKVLLWNISYYNFTKKLEEEITEGPDEYGDFPNPDESGMILSVRFSEKTMGKTTFLETSRIDFKERGVDLSDSVLESALDLDKIIKVLPYDDLEAIFLEISEGQGNKSNDTDTDKKENKRESKQKDKVKEKDADDVAAEEAKKAAAEKARKDAIRAAKKAEAEKEKGGDDCPHGGVFGSDTDSLPQCDTCPQWDACITKKEG